MGFEFVNGGVAASIYLVLFVLFVCSVLVIIWHERTFKTRYSSLLFFGVLRIGAQLCGIAFATLGYEHWQWLVAYLVLGTQGHLALIVTNFYMVVRAHTFATGSSWLKTSVAGPSRIPILRKLSMNLARLFYYIALAANIMIIVGGTMLAGMDATEIADNPSKANTSKILRATGQALFLALSLVSVALALHTIIHDRIRSFLLTAVFLSAPFLTVRGVYGLLSCFIQRMNLFSMANYTSSGLSSYFLVTEYVLGTTMEFITGCIFMSTYYVVHLPQKRLANATKDEKLVRKPDYETL